MKIIPRDEAVKMLQKYVGEDLRPLADKLGITVFKDGKPNKGWAGHVLERCLGLGINSKQAPNGEYWELKSVPLIKRGEDYVPKETMAITMIEPQNILDTPFEKSHLWYKLRSLIICGRLFVNKQETSSALISVGDFDIAEQLEDGSLYNQVKADYELVRESIKQHGFESLTGTMGVLVQPRTKGPGHGSISRAFYARTGFVKTILGLNK